MKSTMDPFSSTQQKESQKSKTRLFVSLSVTDTMRSSGLSRQSTREIIRVSIGSLLSLGLLFIVIYTIILAYIDKKLGLTSDVDRSNYHKKVKFIGKQMDPYNNDFVFRYEIKNRKVMWNASVLFVDEDLPVCMSDSVFRIVIISSPNNRLQRQEIRNNWCKPENFQKSTNSWQCVFLVGDSGSEDLNLMLKEEKHSHNDILIGSFTDSYRNLTLKVIHGLNWVVNHCPSLYVIKTDDDCFVNAGVIYDFLVKHNKISSGLYAGSFVSGRNNLQVIRGNGKWAVSYEDYSKSHYPSYASGIGYILSIDSAKRFLQEVHYIKPISNEDAYTGIVMSSLGVKPTSSSRFLLSPSGLTPCNFLFVMITHDVEAQKQRELMRTVYKSKRLCKHKDSLNTWS